MSDDKKSYVVSYTITITVSGERTYRAWSADEAVGQFHEDADGNAEVLSHNPCVKSLVNDGRSGVEIDCDYVEVYS